MEFKKEKNDAYLKGLTENPFEELICTFKSVCVGEEEKNVISSDKFYELDSHLRLCLTLDDYVCDTLKKYDLDTSNNQRVQEIVIHLVAGDLVELEF